VHHSGGSVADPKADTSNHTAEIVEEWHKSKGWKGIGYHWVIEKDRIVQGRPEHVAGAHTIGRNGKSIGVLVMGNFDVTLPTKTQETLFKTLYLDIKKRHETEFPVPPHRKYSAKTCFGSRLPEDYAHQLAERAVAQEGEEVVDGSPEADAILRAENERLKAQQNVIKSFLKVLIELLQKFYSSLD